MNCPGGTGGYGSSRGAAFSGTGVLAVRAALVLPMVMVVPVVRVAVPIRPVLIRTPVRRRGGRSDRGGTGVWVVKGTSYSFGHPHAGVGGQGGAAGANALDGGAGNRRRRRVHSVGWSRQQLCGVWRAGRRAATANQVA